MIEGKKVAVVILSWNGKQYLEQFLPSVVQYTSTELCEIIVADNCSTDDSVAFIKSNYPNIRLIQNTRNGGYAGGYNDALKRVNAKYFVLLNQDIEVTENWVEKVIAVMEADENIAAAQPKLRDYYKRDYFEYAGPAGGYLDNLGYAFCRGRIFDTIEKDEGQYDDVKEIFWATGACLFIRSTLYNLAGGLDEDFFAHQEEIDLCWRINSMNYKIVCVPSSVVYHVGGGSLSYGNPKKTYLNFRNNLMMLFKNLPGSVLVWKLFQRTILDGLAAINTLVKTRGFSDFKAISKAHFSFWTSIPSLIRKRKKILHKSSPKLFNKSIIWLYFVKGKKKFSEL